MGSNGEGHATSLELLRRRHACELRILQLALAESEAQAAQAAADGALWAHASVLGKRSVRPDDGESDDDEEPVATQGVSVEPRLLDSEEDEVEEEAEATQGEAAVPQLLQFWQREDRRAPLARRQ